MAARIIRNTENTEASDLSKSYFSTDKPRKMALTWGFTMCKTRQTRDVLETVELSLLSLDLAAILILSPRYFLRLLRDMKPMGYLKGFLL